MMRFVQISVHILFKLIFLSLHDVTFLCVSFLSFMSFINEILQSYLQNISSLFNITNCYLFTVDSINAHHRWLETEDISDGSNGNNEWNVCRVSVCIFPYQIREVVLICNLVLTHVLFISYMFLCVLILLVYYEVQLQCKQKTWVSGFHIVFFWHCGNPLICCSKKPNLFIILWVPFVSEIIWPQETTVEFCL